MGDNFYTVDEAVQIIGVSEYTIRRWLKSGKLNGKRVGKYWRISKESVIAVLPDKNNKPE